MSASNKENTANLNVSISRRAKKDAKRLALSPMKESCKRRTEYYDHVYVLKFE